MAKKYTRISCFPETKKKIMEDCKQQFLKSHPEFEGMKITENFILTKLYKYYLNELE